ncbi:MAG: hypothetical protein CUN53_05125 [Phototrophicales bacterium]|nr:MAG: hypothetical protein CUN53_05125 [Phototrophicales bacterium]
MFLQDVPLTGLLFCYVPLILTVLGFIVFAALTDGNSRRTYLRRKIGSEEKNLANQVKARTRPMTVATPAGSYLTVQPTPPVQVVPPELPVSSAPPVLATGDMAQASAEESVSAEASASAAESSTGEVGAAESQEGSEAPKRRRRRSSSESSEGGQSGDASETPASDSESS